MRHEGTAPWRIGFSVAVVSIALAHTIPTCAQTVLNATAARSTYDRGLRHFYWLYTFDPVGHQRRDWYQESAATWNETYEDGRYNHSRVVDANATVDGNDGIICVGDTSTLRLFIPNPDAQGVNPNWLRIQQSGATTWALFALRIEVRESQDRAIADRIPPSQADLSNTRSRARAEAQARAEEAEAKKADIEEKISELEQDIDGLQESVEYAQSSIDQLGSCSGIGAAICDAGASSIRRDMNKETREIREKRQEIENLRSEEGSVAMADSPDTDGGGAPATTNSSANDIVNAFDQGMQRADQNQPATPAKISPAPPRPSSNKTPKKLCTGNAVTQVNPCDTQ